MLDCDGEYDDLPNSLTDNDGMHETGSPTADPNKNGDS
jgi:hypothetical protein